MSSARCAHSWWGRTTREANWRSRCARTQPTTDPRTGRPLAVPPLVILWAGERPLAVKLRSVVAVSRFATMPRVATLIESEALAAGFLVERMPEAGLWRLFSQPPRPRPVGL